MLLVKTVNW